jgi:hypothetical protein
MKSEILTIDDLLWAKENNPDLVAECESKISVLPDLEKYLYWLHEAEATTTVVTKLKRHKGRKLGIHPSSACKKGVCLLKLYFECTDKVKPNRAYDQKMQQIWDHGTLLHDTLQTHFEQMYEDQFEREVRLVNEDLHIYSSTDGIFSFTRTRIILEMKSIKEGGNFGWAKVQKTPMEDNVRQTHFYMALANIPFGIILYMGKNNGEFKEHPVAFDPDLWKELREEIVQPVIDAAYYDGPEVQATPGYHCRWCDFHHGCEAARKHRTNVKGSKRAWGRRG